LAQKGITFMHKVGNYQHWKDSWDSYNSKKITQQSLLFIEDILKIFISSRNSFNNYLINIEFCWDQVILLDCELKDEDYNSLIKSVRHQRAKRFMRIIVGKISFLKYNNWLIILTYIFIPKLNRKRAKKSNNQIFKSNQFKKNNLIFFNSSQKIPMNLNSFLIDLNIKDEYSLKF
jgi:hypothetical protein